MKIQHSTRLANAITWACTTEVNAPKPGNVNCYSDGHAMTVTHFLNSAQAIAPMLSNPDYRLGNKIYHAVLATQQVAHCNTNLGIILLFAPLCQAVLQHTTQQPITLSSLQAELSQQLKQLTVHDAELTYRAIQMAQAGGLGTVEQQDIHTTPTVTLQQAMSLAKNHDTIARQYHNNYQLIFQTSYPLFVNEINCGQSIEWAIAFAYLKILADVPDSLISRKHGISRAKEVSQGAKKILLKLRENNTLNTIEPEIKNWDNTLKQQGINPGTTADIAATTLLVYALLQSDSQKNKISVSA